MFHHLLHMIKSSLGLIWDLRFSDLLARSRGALEEGLMADTAFRRGYAEGYWEGASDLIQVLEHSEVAMLQMSTHHAAHPLPTSWGLVNMDEVH